MKSGKEIIIYDYENHNVIFGSVDNKHNKAIYLTISGWFEPKSEELINYNKVITDLNKQIKQLIFNTLSSKDDTNFIKERSIVDLDIRESGIKYGKRSFMNCELTLFLNSEIPINSDKMPLMLDGIITTIITDTFEQNRNFKFYKKKN